MRKFYLHILSIALVVSSGIVFAQTATIPLVNSYAVVDNSDNSKMFHGHESDASCCGNQDPDHIVTYEVLNPHTQAIIDELKGSTIDYTDGAGLDVNSSMYSSGTGYDLLTWNGGISVGDEVNIAWCI